MILSEENVKKLASMDSQIVINTYNLISTATPEISRENDCFFIVYGGINEEISYIDECIFLTLCEFTYIPLWYLYSILKELDMFTDPVEKLKNWRLLGLIFIDQQTIGEFVRPTNYLFKLLKLKKKKYEVIPYNMLTHNMSKIDIYLKSMIGLSEEIIDVLKEEFNGKISLVNKYCIKPDDVLEVYTDYNNDILDLLEGNKIPEFVRNAPVISLKVVDEKDIKISKNNTEGISRIENTIREELNSGKLNTSELEDYSFFFSAINKGDSYILQFPDLIIPMKRRNNGKPNSIAIEMELTCKSKENYKTNLLKYKNSLKFGSVVWFCGDDKIKRTLTQAFKEIEGTGFTNTYLYNYFTPKRKEISL